MAKEEDNFDPFAKPKKKKKGIFKGLFRGIAFPFVKYRGYKQEKEYQSMEKDRQKLSEYAYHMKYDNKKKASRILTVILVVIGVVWIIIKLI